MAKVFVKFVGGERKEVEASTVSEAMAAVGADKHTAMVNGQPAKSTDKLAGGEFVVLSKQVKGNKDAEVIYKSKELVVTKAGKVIFVNGERLTEKAAEKMAFAILESYGWDFNRK